MGNVNPPTRQQLLARNEELEHGLHGRLRDAGEVQRVIARGFWLRVPHDGGQAELRRRYPDPNGRYLSNNPVIVPEDFLPELLGSEAGYPFSYFQLGKLNREGYPPVSQRPIGLSAWKAGWEELGLDGDVADWYCMVQ